jgi:PIN domain nuclease of toxin-antitoxin system
MRILLDTHTFLWFVLGDVQLSHNARTIIEDSAYEKLISPAVYWEIAIKIGIGKYVLAGP